MGGLLKLIDGKKTYLLCAVAFILGGLQSIGVIDASLVTKIDLFLAPLGLATLRHGLEKNA